MHIRDIHAVRGYRHVVISPHLDDAALSLGGTIAHLAASGERVLVITICAGIPPSDVRLGRFARMLQSDLPTPADYVHLRRDEDRRALETLGADWYWDSALDAIYRAPEDYGRSRAQIFGTPLRGDSLFARATGVVTLAAELAENALIYAPLAIGEHVDHAIIAAAVRLAVDPDRLGWYEDFPYVLLRGARKRRLDKITETTGERLEAETIPIGRGLEAKMDSIACYASQLAMLFHGERRMRRAVATHAGPKRVERIWVASAR